MTLTELNEIKQNYKVLDLAVDFINPSYNISRAKHLDTARYIICTLTENGIPRTVKTNEAARIRLQKPDRTYVYNDCDILEDGRVFITLTEQILAVEGNAVCDIQLTDEETGIIYSTKNFIINIDKTAVNNSVMESSNEFGALNSLIAGNKKLNDELKANEDIRQTNEEQRIDNENQRQTNETDRQDAEDNRINAEDTRIFNENQRIENENTRKANETLRQTQEADRENNTATAVSNAEKAAKKANDAADSLQNKLNSHHFVLSEDKGVANGVAELDANGLIPSNQLPSYVDDVIEGYLNDNKLYKEPEHITEIIGETGKIYIDLISNKTYRWSGSAFAIISETIALGETSSTAYRGDRGKAAYEHSQTAHAPVNAEENQNAFSAVTVGSATVSANSKTDTLILEAGDNITLTPDSENEKIIISSNSSGSVSGDYLPLSGGSMTGKLNFPSFSGGSWFSGRDNACINIRGNGVSPGEWNPAMVMRGVSSSWEIGVLANNNAAYEGFYISKVTDDDYSAKNNNHVGCWMDGNGDFHANNFIGTVNRAGIAHHLNAGGSNEMNFEKTEYWNSPHQLHFGYKWHDGSKAPNISGYFFNNGNCELAPVYASKFHGTATNSDALHGYSASTGADYNTIVRRTENGYIFGSRFNQNSANNENPTISQVMVTNGSDNYLRKASLSHLKTALGSMPPSSHTSEDKDTYGAATNSVYGHVQLFDNYTSMSGGHTAAAGYGCAPSLYALESVYSNLSGKLAKKMQLGSSETITSGSKTLATVPGDIIIVCGSGSGASTYAIYIHSSSAMVISGGYNSSGTLTSFVPNSSLGTLCSISNKTLTINKPNAWSVIYYVHLHIGQ